MSMWDMFLLSPGTFFEMWAAIIGSYALWSFVWVVGLLAALYVIVFLYNIYLWFQPAMTLEELDGPLERQKRARDSALAKKQNT